MKTGSLINMLADRDVPRIPRVGDGCTVLHWSDRDAATVVRVSPDGKRIWIKGDIATRTDKNGMSDAQSYSYSPNPDAREIEYTLRKDGKYHKAGEPLRGSMSLLIGTRMTYYDYSF